MQLASDIVVLLIALLHVYILVLEMFLWERPAGLRAFNQTPESARASKTLAANQGLYNGFLAAGLGWGLVLALRAAAFGCSSSAACWSLALTEASPRAVRSCSFKLSPRPLVWG